MFDSHIHTKFSSDSVMKIEEAVEKSKELGMGIILTDHIDLNYPNPEKFRFNPEEYFTSYASFRSDNLLLGVEIGMNSDYLKENEIIASKYNFDYVLGSVHFLGNNDIYDSITYEGKTKKEVYEKYFIEMVEDLLAHQYIDCMGHIDYICRYCTYEDKYINYNDFKEYIDPVLKTLIDKQIVFELNTRRLNDKKAVSDLTQIYKRYYELGGRYVVLGSDAHNTDSIACNFKDGKELLDYCGLRSVFFKERKLQYNN